nr:MAG TPA: hypothetical protein [Caudoviricetes sp.]
MTLAAEAEFAERWLRITTAIKNAAGGRKEKKEVKVRCHRVKAV